MIVLKKIFLFTLIALFVLTASGCSRSLGSPKNADPNDKTILTVNGDRVTTQDVKRELAVRAAQDPSFKATPSVLNQQLEVIVNRRILIQEATKRRLAEEETFV